VEPIATMAIRGPVEQMKQRILTVPNQLTFLRMAFLPFFIIAIKYEHYTIALVILIVAGISDGLDGLFARNLNQRTALGAYLDPIADKLLLSSSYFILALKGKIGWWLAILVLGRDVLLLVACAVILLVVGYRPFPPSIWGKATTFFEITLIVMVLVLTIWRPEALWIARKICSYCVAAFVIISGLHYSIVVSRQLHAEAPGE
jgi:cardiolipin synthase